METEVKIWLAQAVRDFKSAKHSYHSKDYYVSALLCQQTAEKGLKAILLHQGKEIPKIHDLLRLGREANASPEILEKCSEINPLYFQVRYPDSDELPARKINKREAVHILELTGEILQWIKKIL